MPDKDKDAEDTGANDAGVGLNVDDRKDDTATETGDLVEAGDAPDDYEDPPYEPVENQPTQAAPGQPYEYPPEDDKDSKSKDSVKTSPRTRS